MTATKQQPVAEICSASHDDAQFGERAIKPLCDISGFEYGTPLYAGAAPAAVAPQDERQWICPTRTVADLVSNLLTMDQALPIYGAQYIERDGRRCAIAVPPTVSRERVKDGRWIGQGEELNAAVVWTRAEQPASDAGSSEYPHEQMDAMALARYKVVPSHASMLWSHAVVAGDGVQQLYVGREVECQNMARKFAGAFLDGAFAFHSMAAAPTAQAAPALEAPAAPVTLMTEDQASRWAWDQIREEVGTKGWTAGDSSNFFGFFLHGWNYRGQYELQRPAAMARAALAAAPQAPAAPVGLPWRTGIPPWTDDRSVRVIAVTAHDDFGGVQVHDIRASDFHTDGDGDSAEVARVCTHWAYRDDIWPRADAVAPAAPIPWDNFPAYLIDHCEGQSITEEGLQRALSAMLANPQYAGAAPAAPAVDAALNALIADVRALPTLRASEIDGEESDGTPKHWRNRPFVSLRKLELLLRDRVTASSDTALLNFIAAEYLDLRSFGMPTGQGDADVGWRVIQHHMGEPTERVMAEVYKDDPRSAIRAAIARLERDPYCTGALHEEDAAQATAKGAAS